MYIGEKIKWLHASVQGYLAYKVAHKYTLAYREKAEGSGTMFGSLDDELKGAPPLMSLIASVTTLYSSALQDSSSLAS
jgi:hypothetical protein